MSSLWHLVVFSMGLEDSRQFMSNGLSWSPGWCSSSLEVVSRRQLKLLGENLLSLQVSGAGVRCGGVEMGV